MTNAPELGTFSGAGEVTGENVANGGNGGVVHAMLNLPLGDKVALRVSGFDQDVPGYIDDPSRNETDLNDGHKEGGRASLLAAPTDNLSIRLTATAQESKYSGINTVDVNPTTLQPLYGGLTQERSLSEPSNFKYENYNGTVDWNLGPVRILSSTSFGILDSETVNDATPLYGGPPRGSRDCFSAVLRVRFSTITWICVNSPKRYGSHHPPHSCWNGRPGPISRTNTDKLTSTWMASRFPAVPCSV